jgi:hypothetical protein
MDRHRGLPARVRVGLEVRQVLRDVQEVELADQVKSSRR